ATREPARRESAASRPTHRPRERRSSKRGRRRRAPTAATSWRSSAPTDWFHAARASWFTFLLGCKFEDAPAERGRPDAHRGRGGDQLVSELVEPGGDAVRFGRRRPLGDIGAARALDGDGAGPLELVIGVANGVEIDFERDRDLAHGR